MDKVKRAKEILNRLNEDGRYDEAVIDADAGEICRLFNTDAKQGVKGYHDVMEFYKVDESKSEKPYCGVQPIGKPPGCEVGFCENCNWQPGMKPESIEELGDFVGDKVAITHSEADRLLTDEEILEIQKGVAPLHKAPAGWNKVFILTGKAVAKSQDAKTVERILKWGIQPCLEHNTGGGVFTRRECPKCWQTLIKEEGL